MHHSNFAGLQPALASIQLEIVEDSDGVKGFTSDILHAIEDDLCVTYIASYMAWLCADDFCCRY